MRRSSGGYRVLGSFLRRVGIGETDAGEADLCQDLGECSEDFRSRFE